jgi:hypothetical protein
LKIHINNLAALVNCSPEVMLLTVDFDKDFIDVESIAEAPVLSFQPAGINGTELDAPETDRFSRHSDASFSEQALNITMTVTTRLRLKRK